MSTTDAVDVSLHSRHVLVKKDSPKVFLIASSARADQLANEELLLNAKIGMQVGDEGEDGSENKEVGDGTIGTSLSSEFLHSFVASHNQRTKDTLHAP